MKTPKYKHYFTVIDGKFIFEEKDMLEYKRKALEGVRGYAIIEEEGDNVTPNQYAYYFGGIIRKECMESDVFKGFSEMQIHNILFAELRSSVKGLEMPDGTTKTFNLIEDFSSYKKNDMTKYIEEVIALLQTEYNIHPKPASHYKYNRFYMNPKVMNK